MSYDVIFIPRAPGQPWGRALKKASRKDHDPAPFRWLALETAMWDLLGTLESSRYQLAHAATGIRVTLRGERAALTVPYWYSGDEARTVVGTMLAVGATVEAATGLRGFDPQLAISLRKVARRPELAVEVFDHIATAITGRGQVPPA